MKWLTVKDGAQTRHGYLDGDTVKVTGAGDLMTVITGEDTGTEVYGEIQLSKALVLAPLLRPGKIIAVAANYQEHVEESGSRRRNESKASPRLFLKPDTSIVGTGAALELNAITHELDWEVELAVVLGRTTRNVSVLDALDHVFGYTTSNDISARSLDLGIERDGESQTGFFDWLAGKWLDGSAPMGPYLVTTDEVPDPQSLGLTLWVNETKFQDSTTAGMIHSVAELVAFSSRLMTLNAGDVILTGTPAGVGGATGTFLNVGDVMVAELSGLGRLVTPVVSPRPE